MLAPARVRADGRQGLAISDFFDFGVYVDAATDDIRRWYVERFLRLRGTAFRDPASYFRRYASLTEPEAVARAEQLWDTINGPEPARRTSSRPAAAPPWCCARTATTPCAGCGCASASDRLGQPQPHRPPQLARPAPCAATSTARNPSCGVDREHRGVDPGVEGVQQPRRASWASSRRRLATFIARPSRCPRCSGSTSVPLCIAPPRTISSPSTSSVLPTSAPSGATAAVTNVCCPARLRRCLASRSRSSSTAPARSPGRRSAPRRRTPPPAGTGVDPLVRARGRPTTPAGTRRPARPHAPRAGRAGRRAAELEHEVGLGSGRG